MCGIVCYFGGAGNNLTRILTGMAAIIYRAPDSTGVGLLGDDREPIVVRKAVGALPQLVSSLIERGVYPNPDETALALCLPDDSPEAITACQNQLLCREGIFQGPRAPDLATPESYLSYDQLVELNPAATGRLRPGQAGRPGGLPAHHITNRRSLKQLVDILTTRYDLSPRVTQTIIADALRRHFRRIEADTPLPVTIEDLLESFQEVFERAYWDDGEAFYTEPERRRKLQDPLSRKHMWRLLIKTPVSIPADYDRDAVRCLFRLLDGALLSRLHSEPALAEHLTRTMRALYAAGNHMETGAALERSAPAFVTTLDWPDLYRVEKSVNVYGLAAASAYQYLKEEETPQVVSGHTGGENLEAGTTDPHTLRYLASPIIGHGRWALQSTVTANNAHPFIDRNGERSVVMNGQFNVTTENRLREFLLHAGLYPRTENSGEYVALLWGHYFQVLDQEKKHCEFVQSEIEAGLDDLCLGSETIDYRMLHRVRGRTTEELDEIAFREAVRQIVAEGGQIAVAAISTGSPQRLYLAAHKRPVFIVRRLDNDDIMVVSDINAAMGLFPQVLIRDRKKALLKLEREQCRQLRQVSEDLPGGVGREAVNARYRAAKERLLTSFRVRVCALDQASLIARIEAVFGKDGLRRRITFSDFDGRPVPEIDTFETVLDPVEIRKEALQSFHEMHLAEIPERLQDALQLAGPSDSPFPDLPVREKYLVHRFGHNLETLRRVVLFGMGSSYHVALMARAAFRRLLPQIHCLALRPVEVEQVAWSLDPDRDLVLLLSVSGTAADMVELARDLGRHRVSAVGITEKPFADMALTTLKSGGVIPIHCGEEVTYTAVKSTASLLMATHLSAVWLARRTGRSEDARRLMAELRTVPGLLSKVLHDPAAGDFCARFNARFSGTTTALVIDALNDAGSGREAASRLEDAAWTVAAKCIDYRALPLNLLSADSDRRLVLVNATAENRTGEALGVMKQLACADVPFAVVACENGEREEIQFYTNGLAYFLPNLGEALQPYADLVFFNLLAGNFAVACGRAHPGFPRNRAKSVTVARSRPESRIPAAEPLLEYLDEVNREQPSLLPSKTRSAWEEQAASGSEAGYYRDLRLLAAVVGGDDARRNLLSGESSAADRLSVALAGVLFEEEELFFAACDQSALAVAQDLAGLWNSQLSGIAEAVPIQQITAAGSSDALVLVLATESSGFDRDFQRLTPLGSRAAWFGPGLATGIRQAFSDSLGYFAIPDDWQRVLPEALYFALNLQLLDVLKTSRPKQADAQERILRLAPCVFDAVLNDTNLDHQIRQAVALNRNYRSASFLGANRGAGLAWSECFGRSGSLSVESYLYEEGAYGPVVTVDSNPRGKYLRLDARSEVVEAFGEKRVAAWEKRFLDGRSVDDFLAAPNIASSRPDARPFPVDGAWYLPVLRPDYPADRDNLIIVDATGSRTIPRAMDALSVYGCRYARIVLIVQRPEDGEALPEGLFQYPLSQVLELPPLNPGGGNFSIPDRLLPPAMNMVAVRMASTLAAERKIVGGLTAETLLGQAFGALGEALQQAKVHPEQLNHRVIEALRHLAPVVETVTGIKGYRIIAVRSGKQLADLAATGRLESPQQTLASFATRTGNDTPFFLAREETSTVCDGAVAADPETPSAPRDSSWFAVYGNSWMGLAHRRLEFGREPAEHPRIEIPILDRDGRIDRLLHVFLGYRRWIHTEEATDQLRETAAALGKDTRSHQFPASQYVKIINLFNEEVSSEPFLWTDPLLALVPRGWLFSRSSKSIARILADRASELLHAAQAAGVRANVQQIGTAIESVWPQLGAIESYDDGDRWNRLKAALSSMADE